MPPADSAVARLAQLEPKVQSLHEAMHGKWVGDQGVRVPGVIEKIDDVTKKLDDINKSIKILTYGATPVVILLIGTLSGEAKESVFVIFKALAHLIH